MEETRQVESSGGRFLVGQVVLGTLLLTCILVPFFLWEERLGEATAALLRAPRSRWWMALVLGGLLAADLALPVPSSLVATAAGSLLGFWGGAGVSWAGLMVGSLAGYWLGRGASATSLRRWVGGSEERVARYIERQGSWALVVCRAVPVLAEASVVLAGFHRMRPLRFVFLCALSNLGLACTYAALGAWAVDAGSFVLAFVSAMVLPAAGMYVTRGRGWRP